MNLLFSALIGIVVGIIITIPLGPISIYVAQQVMGGEAAKALHVAAGSVVVDILYCLIITLGLISLVAPWLHNPAVQIGLSVFLLLYGLKMLLIDARKAQIGKNGGLKEQREKFERGHYYVLLGVTMALANPTLFISWTAVLSFVSAHGLLTNNFLDKIVFSFATGLGSFGWFIGLALFVHSRRHTLSPSFIRRAGTITALVIIGFGVYFTFNVLQHLNGAA